MSNPTFQQDCELDDCQFERIIGQLGQQISLREQVTTALNEANAAFAAQCTQPDGYKYTEACDDLAKFLDLKIPLEYNEQKLVVQVLQVACAMHENAVNNPTLTSAQRSSHHLATTSLVRLCESALQGSVSHTELWCEVFGLCHRAEQAFTKATDALDVSKYFDFENMTDDYLYESGSGAGQTSAESPPVVTTSNPAPPRASVHITTDVRLSSRPTRLKDDRSYTGRVAPLGRAHTMPTLSQVASGSYFSRTVRLSSKAYSRGHGLHTLQETE